MMIERVAMLAQERKLRRRIVHLEVALMSAYKLLSGLLTDNQLSFVQPDGRSARDRLQFIEKTLYEVNKTLTQKFKGKKEGH